MDAEMYVNDPSLEMAWAVRAAECASIHINLLISCKTATTLKLNKHQEEIYKRFREVFPLSELNVEQVAEDDLKSGPKKEKWRLFCEEFKDNVDDYNMATMLRSRADGIYDAENTIIAPKIIYLAIEGARNIEGINDKWRHAYSAKQAVVRGGEAKDAVL